MRAKLEALCAKWEALQAEHSDKARGWGKDALVSAGWVMALCHCRAGLRALLSESPERVRMEPQPLHWSNKNPPVSLNENIPRWGIVCRPEHGGLETEIYTAPSPAHRPVLIDGVWWWEVQP